MRSQKRRTWLLIFLVELGLLLMYRLFAYSSKPLGHRNNLSTRAGRRALPLQKQAPGPVEGDRLDLTPLVQMQGRRADAKPLVLVINRKCPFAQRAWLGLEESGLKYEVWECCLSPKPQWLLDLNPKGRVPVLIDEDGNSIDESEVIIDAIAARAPSAFGEGVEAERVASWRDIVSNELLPAREHAKRYRDREYLDSVLDRLDSLVVGPYVAGDAFTLADVSAAPVMQRFFEDDFVPGRYSRLHAWWKAVQSRPSFKKTKLGPGRLLRW